MTIAVPVAGGSLSSHFGHCEHFAVFETEDKNVKDSRLLTPPPHEPGAFPRWLKQQGAEIVIAGGMGQRAQSLFAQEGIQVVVGTADADPQTAVESYLEGNLATGQNLCDH